MPTIYIITYTHIYYIALTVLLALPVSRVSLEVENVWLTALEACAPQFDGLKRNERA